MKKYKKNNWLWVILAAFCVVIVGLSVGIVVKLMHKEYPLNVQEVNAAYNINVLAGEIINKFENDVDYTMRDAKIDFVQLIDSLDDREKVYAVIPYADFVFKQTGDIQKAARIVEDVIDDADDYSKSEYYILLGRLYREAGMHDQSAKYYNMASGSYVERDSL